MLFCLQMFEIISKRYLAYLTGVVLLYRHFNRPFRWLD
jgi:hypothetical protein